MNPYLVGALLGLGLVRALPGLVKSIPGLLLILFALFGLGALITIPRMFWEETGLSLLLAGLGLATGTLAALWPVISIRARATALALRELSDREGIRQHVRLSYDTITDRFGEPGDGTKAIQWEATAPLGKGSTLRERVIYYMTALTGLAVAAAIIWFNLPSGRDDGERLLKAVSFFLIAAISVAAMLIILGGYRQRRCDFASTYAHALEQAMERDFPLKAFNTPDILGRLDAIQAGFRAANIAGIWMEQHYEAPMLRSIEERMIAGGDPAALAQAARTMLEYDARAAAQLGSAYALLQQRLDETRFVLTHKRAPDRLDYETQRLVQRIEAWDNLVTTAFVENGWLRPGHVARQIAGLMARLDDYLAAQPGYAARAAAG
jgi:hypothetical protein